METEGKNCSIGNEAEQNADPEGLTLVQSQHIDIEINRVSSADHKITEDNANNPQITFCPACEQLAGDQTIECEECGEWYHFNCTGLDNKSADSIPKDIPFICLFCNDNLLYSQNPEESEQSLNFDVNPSSNTEPKTLHREPSPQPCENKENDNLSEGGEKAVVEKPNLNEIHAKKNKGKKSTNSSSNNSNNNKRSSRTEDKETLLAQKYYRVDSRNFSKWANSPIRLSKGGQGLERMGNLTS